MTDIQLVNFFDIDKRVYIEFINADMDGELLDSDSGPSTVRHFVKMIYVTTDHGTVGQSISSIPFSKLLDYIQGKPIPDQFIVGAGLHSDLVLNHRYTIDSRMEDGNEVWLQVRHSVREPDSFNESPATDTAPASEWPSLV